MEEMERKGFAVSRVIELYKEDGFLLTTEQAEKILLFSQKLVNIVVTHYRAAAYTVDSPINSEKIL